MTFGEQLRTALVNDATVAALVTTTGQPEIRIFPNVLPEGKPMPSIVYNVISDVPINSLDGSPATRTKNARVQFDCYARADAGVGAYTGCNALADAVEAVIGALASPAPGLSAWQISRRDLYDDPTEYHRVLMEFSVWR